jgi:hypothetical protein
MFVESNVLSAMYTLDSTDMTPTGGTEHFSTYHVEIEADAVTGTEGNFFFVICEYDGLDYTNDFGVPNTANTDTLAAFFRYDLFTADVSYNAEPICDLVVVTDMPAEEWNEVLVEFDASATTDPDLPEDELFYHWDFDGDEIYDEDPDDAYTGDPWAPTHTYIEDYTGVVNLMVTDLAGDESICTTDPLEVYVKGCDSLDLPTTGGRWYSSEQYYTIYAYYGGAVSKGTTNQVFAGREYPSTYDHRVGAMPIGATWSASNCVTADACASNIYVNGYYGFEFDSDDNFWYVVYDYYEPNYYARRKLYYMPWNEGSSTWGSYTNFSGSNPLPGTYNMYKFTLDENDNPIQYAYDYYSSSDISLFHWTGSAWTEIDISSVLTESYSYILDINWLPETEQYIVMMYVYVSTPSYHYEPKIYVINTDGTLETTMSDIFDFAPDAYIRGGIHVDYDNSDCNIFVTSGSVYDSSNGTAIIRYNGIFDDVTEGYYNFGYDYPSYYCMNMDYASEDNRIYTGQQTTSCAYYDMPDDW